jgi:hypothetical protein
VNIPPKPPPRIRILGLAIGVTSLPLVFPKLYLKSLNPAPRQWVDSSTATYATDHELLEIPPTRVGGLFISCPLLGEMKLPPTVVDGILKALKTRLVGWNLTIHPLTWVGFTPLRQNILLG